MAQPDISSILAALTQGHNGTPQVPTPQQQPPTPSQGPPQGYAMPTQPPSAPPQHASYLPQPSSTGSVDLSQIKPINTGAVSIADAIAKAKSIAADKGMQSYDPRQQSDPRSAGRSYRSSRSRSPPRRESYNSNPYRDERRGDPRRGTYQRTPSPDRSFRGARDPPLGYRGNDGETETIRVKSSLVGLIIGRNGENLRKVESETGARVQFIQAKDSHQVERQCTISGNLRARENAKAAIFAIVEENGGQNVPQDKGAYTAGMPGRAKVNLPALREGEKSTQIMVPDKTVGLIIGRGGETIKDLQERSGCHVNIVGENKSVNGLRPVNLIGDDRATAVAKDLILEIVESDNRAGAAGNASKQQDQSFDFGRAGNGGGRDYTEKTIRVPSEAVGMIIGKGGETIKDMQKSTGCKINVNQPNPPDVYRNIDLAGSARQMADAEHVIWEKVETVQQRDAAAGRNQGGRGAAAAAPQQQQQQYDAYSQQQPQASAMSAYGQYMPPLQQQQQQMPQMPQMPAFQMPPTQQTPGPSDQNPSDPYAAWGGQAALMAYWSQQLMQGQQQQQQQQQQPPGGAPGS